MHYKVLMMWLMLMMRPTKNFFYIKMKYQLIKTINVYAISL